MNRTKLRTIGPVSIYKIDWLLKNTTTAEFYPAQEDLSDDRFFRLILSDRLAFRKTTTGADVYWSLALAGASGGGEEDVDVWSRSMSSLLQTDDPANCLGVEFPFLSTGFQTTAGTLTGRIIPPGIAIRCSVNVASNDYRLYYDAVCLEAQDIKLLLPFLGGPATFEGISDAYGER